MEGRIYVFRSSEAYTLQHILPFIIQNENVMINLQSPTQFHIECVQQIPFKLV